MSTIFLYVLLLVIPLFLMVAKQRKKFAGVAKKFPQLPKLPLVGSAYLFTNPEDALLNMVKYFRQYGPNIFMHIFHKSYLVTSDTKLSEMVLGSPKLIDKSDEYDFLHEWFGTGLLTSTGYKWKSHRKILTPSFHYKILEQFVTVFDEKSFILVEKLKQNVGKNSFDVFNLISLFTLDIICETAMGTEVNAQDDPNSPFVSSVRKASSVLFKRIFSPLRFNLIFYFSKDYKQFTEALKVLTDFSKAIIQKRKKCLENVQMVDDQNEFGMKRKHSFLDVLLLAKIDGRNLTDEEVREEVDTFIFEGHDTTSIAISFTLYLLSKHQDVQEKAYKEVIAVMGEDREKSTTYENLQEMKYLEKVVKESLRLYPSVSIFARKLNEDVEYDGTVLPAGLIIALVPFALHRNPQVYPDPEKFDPERFSHEESVKRHPYAYVPFSAGPRNCIGQKFAMLELKCTIAKLLRHYRILAAIPEYEIKPMAKMTLESSNGIKVRLEERR